MKYVLNIIQPDGPPPPPERLDPIMRDVRAFMAELEAAGARVWNAGLAPASASTMVRAKPDGAVELADGPYAEGKEHIGGLVVVEAVDLRALPGMPTSAELGRRLFACRQGRAIVPHGHNNMCTGFVVLRGRWRGRHYDRVAMDREHCLLRPTIDRGFAVGECSTARRAIHCSRRARSHSRAVVDSSRRVRTGRVLI